MDETRLGLTDANASPPAKSRFPLWAACLVAAATLIIGAGALWSGVPWAAVAITASTVAGITAWTLWADSASPG